MNRLGFRHDNLAAHAAGGRRQRAPRDRRRLHALRHRRRAGAPAFDEQRERFEPALARAAGARHHAARPPRREQRGAAARRARLVRLRPPGPPALRHRSAAARRDAAAATCPVTPQPYRAREGHAARRGHRLRAADASSIGRRPSPSCRPATPTASTAAWPGSGYMLVRGRRAPIVGSVCMDMTMIDVTGLDVAPGDEVVILGAAGR